MNKLYIYILTSIILTASLCNLTAADNTWGSAPTEEALEKIIGIKSKEQEAEFVKSMQDYAKSFTAYKTLLLSRDKVPARETDDLNRLDLHSELVNSFMKKMNKYAQLKPFTSALEAAIRIGKAAGAEEGKKDIAENLDDIGLFDMGSDYMRKLRVLDRSKNFGEILKKF